MNILFLTLLDLKNLNESGIYHDLVNELKSRGHNVTVVTAAERKKIGKTNLYTSNNIEVLSVKIGNITKTNTLIKGINTLLIEKYFASAIKNYLKNHDFDLIVYTTPPITFYNLIKRLKNKYNCKTYLLLKDIFPQNAVDLNLFKKSGLIYKYFRSKEKSLYKISDYIGCMSQENINYIEKNNNITAKTHIFRNALYEKKFNKNLALKNEIFSKYSLDMNKKLFIYGGNIGVPQGINFIKEVMSNFDKVNNSQLLIVGNGTHYKDILLHSKTLSHKCVKVLNIMPKEEYDVLVSCADVGLIFLDNRFTIPNYPSRLTSLLNAGLPILASTDENTDLSYDIIEWKCGLWNKSNDINGFIKNANRIVEPNTYAILSGNSKKCYREFFKIEDNVDGLLNMIK
ncbi:glycosyltransferase family 4 protein [Macrococcus epidermidis]|uniref:glycosyltransferase family 4 protein n=1 Tax=Macrococcus epidermidis TaxID=1902580 RepID=UPI0020B8B54E|nr:glycosyltransferase family 4 protein [Macrococcus epidermidis]UTH15984.1 glycosyltransferase family 4 protein [Macrococcus epidermidis]